MWYRSSPAGGWVELTNKVSKTGDTMTGQLTISPNSTSRYVALGGDDRILSGGSSAEAVSTVIYRDCIYFCPNRDRNINAAGVIQMLTGSTVFQGNTYRYICFGCRKTAGASFSTMGSSGFGGFHFIM
jgi:hypothetical protein